jgi:hypothetical protein
MGLVTNLGVHSSPLWGEAESRSDRVRWNAPNTGADPLTRLRAARGLGLSPSGRGKRFARSPASPNED